MENLRKIIDLCGGVERTALLLRISRESVRSYLRGVIPESRQQHIDLLARLSYEEIMDLMPAGIHDTCPTSYTKSKSADTDFAEHILGIREKRDKPIGIVEWTEILESYSQRAPLPGRV